MQQVVTTTSQVSNTLSQFQQVINAANANPADWEVVPPLQAQIAEIREMIKTLVSTCAVCGEPVESSPTLSCQPCQLAIRHARGQLLESLRNELNEI